VDPYDRAAYAVLADRLIELGDPRGELIALQLKRRSAEMELAATDVIERMGDAAKPPPGVTFEWAFGYAKTVKIEPGTAKGTKDALAHPSCRFLVELRVGHNNAPLTGSINAIAAAQRPCLRVLQLGKAPTHADYSHHSREVGDLSGLWAACPALQDLDIVGTSATFGDIRAPKLLAFKYVTSSLGAGEAASISRAAWPAIKQLEIECGTVTTDPHRKTTPWLGKLLERDDMPALEQLVIEHTVDTDKLIPALVTSPLLKTLRELSLAHGALTETGIDLIVKHRAAFARLESFDLSFTELTDSQVARLSVLPNISAASQGGPGDDYYEDADE
jgi:hypothetical protein